MASDTYGVRLREGPQRRALRAPRSRNAGAAGEVGPFVGGRAHTAGESAIVALLAATVSPIGTPGAVWGRVDDPDSWSGLTVHARSRPEDDLP